jgi:MFS family permease
LTIDESSIVDRIVTRQWTRQSSIVNVMLPSWWRSAPPLARRALVAASLGWMLDAMDVLLYSFVLDEVGREFQLDDRTSGLLIALPLASSALGGAFFGWLADRLGRTRALMLSIAVYSVATALCGLAQSVEQLAAFRILLGLGMGGEWATGAALVAETWPDEHRGKAMGVMQSSWAIGYAAAALVNASVRPFFGWRGVFLAGVLPALLTLWIRRSVGESPLWRASRLQPGRRTPLGSLLRGSLGRLALAVTAMNAATMFAWWGLFTWIPSYLARPAAEGGAGLSLLRTSTWIVLMQAGMWLGYVSFGFLADRFGRRRAYVTYLLVAAALVPLYGAVRQPALLLLLGPLVAFFGTGYFSGFGAVTAEIFPTAIRATAQGLTYNAGRGVSALAPLAVGTLAGAWGLGAAFSITSAAFLLAALLWIWIPETRGRALER